jgi:hypothetical protein
MYIYITDCIYTHIHIYVYNYVTFKYVEGGPDREAPEVVKYQFVYLNVSTVCLNELDSVCLNGRAGQGKLSQR